MMPSCDCVKQDDKMRHCVLDRVGSGRVGSGRVGSGRVGSGITRLSNIFLLKPNSQGVSNL